MNTDKLIKELADWMGAMEINQLTEIVIGKAFVVSNTLGVGYLEKVYENALALELREAGLKIELQKSIPVQYKGKVVGDYIADIIVDSILILEIKNARAIDASHEAQLLNYLKTTGIHYGLILNFGTSHLGIKRKVL
jgi:GxxExxY protein